MAWTVDSFAQERSSSSLVEVPPAAPPIEPQPQSALPPVPNAAPALVPALPPPIAPDLPNAVVETWPTGKPSTIRCGDQAITRSLCRYGDYTGTLTTYHQDGSVHQVLSFIGGLLDGLSESYDNGGHLLSREFFFAGKSRSPGSLPTGIPTRIDPPLPPPPTFDSQSPVATVPRITMDKSEEDTIRGLVGIGVRGTVGFLASSAVIPFYGGGLLQVIPNSGRVRPELGAGIMVAARNDYQRIDIPISVGMQADLISGGDTVFLVLAVSTIFANRKVLGSVPGPNSEAAWLLGAEGGVGVRLRRSAYSYWLGDVRLGGLGRADTATPILLPQTDGPPAAAIGGQFRMTLNLTFIGNIGT